ncbi:protein split ends-like isoform X1 [Vanessa cardui]|uniref:protein split ends-like isoform X1 n=1 Tax=Vanessa cardui TaxID=171605 RepID=UPI001F140FA2|nr:protein split ends-like isoform X1 [Vanessa cardui]
MVRETRHLWVGNLPDNIREDRIREHFKRYGRVQNVKLLGRMESPSASTNGAANSGVCATVAFMDIKSASKAHNIEHVLDERTLTTEYYEPAAIPSSAGAPSAGSSPAGSGYSGSSSSVNSAPAPVTTSRYHLSGEESAGNACAMAASAAAPATWRGTNDSATEFCRRGNTPAAYGRYQRNSSTAPYATPPSNVERTTPHHRWYATGAGGAAGAGGAGGESTPSTPGGGTERRRRLSGSGSSRSESSSPEPSDTSRASTPATHHHPQHHNARRTPPPHPHQWPSTANGRPLAICVRNLPTRSTDSSLKDGLYHEYKKHGKVVWVKVVGQNADRYAVVRFKKPSDVEKALEVSQDKLFFGCKISVAPHQSCDDDAESAKPYETDIDEYHPKATRTLFIGNLEKDVTQQQLRDKFKHFGRIIEIDIKKGSGGGAGYAFCQYASISSVVEAIRAMDGEYVGSSRVKLGFGKPVATTCVWVDGLTEHTEKQVLGAVSRCGAATSVCVDRAAGAALVHFEQAAAAGGAVRELRRVAAQLSAAEPDHPRLCVDYASRECQEAFYEQLEKHGGSAALAGTERVVSDIPGRFLPATRHESIRFEAGAPRSRAPSFGRSSSRTPRYNAHDHYDPAEYAADRRYRVYDELGSSPQTDEATYEDRLQSVVVSPHRGHKHRRDSSPEERKLSKERHRSAGAGSRRSRSGSRSHVSRRRHRRRRDESGSRGSRTSRAGTPLRDEPDAPPTEPRRPPRERPPLPMSLPLPKFAVQLLRAAPAQPRSLPPPAPASPPRPPSASSSSGGSAPHSPSLEERIRSLDEKYERWTGSRAHADAPDRARLRHRLLELDVNEVKPSEVVLSLLAKRSVFDEDSERLEGAARIPSPASSPHSLPTAVPRVLRYPFPVHSVAAPTVPCSTTTTSAASIISLGETDEIERLHPIPLERITKLTDFESLHESRLRTRTPSTDRPVLEFSEKKASPPIERDRMETRVELDGEHDKHESKRRNSSILILDEKNSSASDKIAFDKGNLVRPLDHIFLASQEQKLDQNLLKESRCHEEKITTIKKEDNIEDKSVHKTSDSLVSKYERNCFRDEAKIRNQDGKVIKQETIQLDIQINPNEKYIFKSEYDTKTESIIQEDIKQQLEQESKMHESSFRLKKETERCKEKSFQNHISKETVTYKVHSANHLNAINYVELMKKNSEPNQDSKYNDKNNKEKCEPITASLQEDKSGKENIDCIRSIDKSVDESKHTNNQLFSPDRATTDSDKIQDESNKNDRDKIRHSRDRVDKDIEKERSKINKSLKLDRNEKERKSKEDLLNIKFNSEKIDKVKTDKEGEKLLDKVEKSRHDDKSARHENHKKDKAERERKRDLIEVDILTKSLKREEKHKHDRSKKDSDLKRDMKKETDSSKSRKSSRDESSRDICRKDSTDSTTSRASHDSLKSKDLDIADIKEEPKCRSKCVDTIHKLEVDKEISKSHDFNKLDTKLKIKSEIKEEKEYGEQHFKHKLKEEKECSDHNYKNKVDNYIENATKTKADISEKQRHYSVDSPNLDSKRKERLNSCSSLPSHIGHKRRMSSQDSIDCLNEDNKKSRQVERRESKDSRSLERHKTTKFSKGHFAKIIESKTKDDKKNQVKPPDDMFPNIKDCDIKEPGIEKNKTKKSPSQDNEDKSVGSSDASSESLQNNIDFLATLELRSSEEDERQKAMRKEMKEKKRIQQLQQIQELQMQQDALQQAEISNKMKEDRKVKNDDKKKETREKRMSTDRKSRDERNDPNKRRNRKQVQSTDTSDSDEPKKHSIFDIVDDEPTYISMYDKVKARSCKNMQKQEEEKRQEKIKAKFSQLKQSRAKREEKKRSSWDEDSDSENERRKCHKVSMDSSTDDDHIVIHSKKREKSHGSSLEYDRNRPNDYFDVASNEEDSRNKLSRKNSRTRIMSDTSDEENAKRNLNRSPNFIDKIKKEIFSDSESSQKFKDMDLKESSEDKVKKTSLLNLFGKSDSEDNRLKSGLDIEIDYRMSFGKNYPNDLSSENESIPPNRNISEIRKKHKKKQKKYKFSFSDEDTKTETAHETTSEIDTKHKNPDKSRRHSNKKEKRKEKIRESLDTDELRDEKVKIKKERRSPHQSYDLIAETVSNNNKKEGKMEDIFGPLSDESDRDSGNISTKTESLPLEFESQVCTSNEKAMPNNDEIKIKERDDSRRKKEKKRKEKRYFTKDDDNSLDVDAVSKAIEARLFADSSNMDDNRTKQESLTDFASKKSENELKYPDINYKRESITFNKYSDKSKKESRERKKKKKKNREERQSRKEHHHSYHHEKISKMEGTFMENNVQLSPKTMLLDIPLPNDIQKVELTDKSDDSKSLSESPSLPRITDSPPFLNQSDENNDMKSNECDTPNRLVVDDGIEIDYDLTRNIEVNDIPMPPPIDNIVQDISEVPLPKDPPLDIETDKQSSLSSFTLENEEDTDVKISEDAVRSIPNVEKDTEKQSEKSMNDSHSCKIDKKIEEKPRAIISQEETEDAVAALLGESFGGKVNTFDGYEEVETNTVHQIEIETTPIENELIPEEDAEEMRQAVQNLNASEMEMKPDTPVSDNDLLLIDTDTEETEDTNQDPIERLPVNIITANQSLNNNTKISLAQTTEISNIIVTKPKTNIVQTISKESNEIPKNSNESKSKPILTKQETAQQITSTATPVITSWTLSNNKLIEQPHLLNIPVSSIPSRDSSENKPTHITANIVQIKAPQSQNMQVNNTLRPIINTNRVNPPYQVINQMIRPQVSSMQPPTIKIPEPHIIYQKPQGIVISPRMTNEQILLSPKPSQQTETMTSPRLSNMVLNTSPQNINSVGLPSPNALQQRSPGQVTVVRMQQPPLSPIQTVHIPHGARTMVSPNRPNSVLVQTQGTPIHFNRLPVTPVLAPISKQLNANNVIQQPKGTGVNNQQLMHQQKIIATDCRKTENITDTANIILSPTRLPPNSNHTVMTPNRLIPMQNALHVNNINSALHISNKVLLNNKNQLIEKRETQTSKSDHNNHIPFVSSPIIHVAGVSHSTSSIIQGTGKSSISNFQETTVSRGHGSNVIHTINSQRLLTTSPMTNVVQLDANRGSPSVLSMATIKPASSLGKSEPSNSVVVTTSSLGNVVMTPLLLKSSSPKGTIRLHSRSESDHVDNLMPISLLNHTQRDPDSQHKQNDQCDKNIEAPCKELNFENSAPAPTTSPVENIGKCETDFEELLKDNTNEIKISNDPDKKVEINVGKNITLIPQSHDKRESTDYTAKDKEEIQIPMSKQTLSPEIPKIKNDNDFSTFIEKSEDCSKENDLKITNQNKVDENLPNVQDKNDKMNPTYDINDNSKKSDLREDKEPFFGLITNHNLNVNNDTKNIEENEYWTAKDVNIESVIKKVDSLCNEHLDEKKEEIDEVSDLITKGTDISKTETNLSIESVEQQESNKVEPSKVESFKQVENKEEPFHETNMNEESIMEKTTPTGKRGGRSARGKRTDKNQDRVQTRQISKPSRGSSKRGRGRLKADKKIKSLVSSNLNNMPGDVYDFHEDSGDETVTSPNKTEVRPRLILTIKSPLSGHSNAIATSTLSITPKDQVKSIEKSKEDKIEVFASPSANTRKSRRLQEKDIQRSTVDDVIDDVIKGSTVQFKNNKESNKKRSTRLSGAKTNIDKVSQSDTRKSPRGVKRTRDRSLSDASLDSSDENAKKDDAVKETKIAKLVEPIAPPKIETETMIKMTTTTSSTLSLVSTTVVVPPSNNPTPIMKPPKKMISEISAKLASAFEAAANATNRVGGASPIVHERPLPLSERQPEIERLLPPAADLSPAAPGEVVVGDAGYVRRIVDNVPSNMMPVGATEATDARVQSPALPHRPPSVHHPPDRVTPILVRGGEGEAGAASALGGVAGASRGFRGAYAGPASLPRGAHHPPHSKQVAVVGPQHHPGSRVTITSVPAVSPQGQVSMGEGMYPHFSHHHYQMYQQHFRATQYENLPTPTSFTRGALEAEGSEAPTPPLELRRPPSARVPRPAHSPSPLPHDRHIMYGVRCGRSPPPAHGTSRPPAALPPPGPPGPPHASQVPREADSLQMLLRRYPVMWQGLLALKNDSAAVQMHFVGGNPGVAADALLRNSDGTAASLLRIAQRMRLEPAQLDQVHRKMKLENEHCMLLALPCGRDHMDVLQQSTNLTAGFITYLQRKQAAGIVNVAPTPGHQQSLYTVHIFPSCDFANENLNRIAPDLMHRVANIAHLLIVIATAIG